MDASLETSQSYSDLAGGDRKNDATGNTADTNVVWLTKSNAKERAGSVKVVTLDDGSYCVLWEKIVKKDDSKGRWTFDSLRYVILDERGNVLRKETTVYNAKKIKLSKSKYGIKAKKRAEP